MNTIDNSQFLMSSNGGHLVIMVKVPRFLQPSEIKHGEKVICWDDSELSNNPYIQNAPEKGTEYTIQEINLESFGIRLLELKNEKGTLSMEPGFVHTRFCTPAEWNKAPTKMIKSYPHAKPKLRTLGRKNSIQYATSYDISFDNFDVRLIEHLVNKAQRLTTLDYDFYELSTDEIPKAKSVFSLSLDKRQYYLFKHTTVEASDLYKNSINNTRLVTILQETPSSSFSAHAKVALLLWIKHDRPYANELGAGKYMITDINIIDYNDTLLGKSEIEDLLDFSNHKSIDHKACRFLKIEH